jgi:hypothetical protein
MQEYDYPALYRSANHLSLESQSSFFRALKFHLTLLVAAAALSIVTIPHWSVATLQLIVLLGALSLSIFLFAKRPDRYWYAGRAVAESIKTVTWRYVSRAEPFEADDYSARSDFQHTLQAIVNQNQDVAESLTLYLAERQVTSAMESLRGSALLERRRTYEKHRIDDQLNWYANKAKFNRRRANGFFSALIFTNAAAVVCAALRISFAQISGWPTDILVAAAASILGWMQARRFSELAAAYALAAHEIGIIREQALQVTTDAEFSRFVGDAENAFSREHTQWVARKDV